MTRARRRRLKPDHHLAPVEAAKLIVGNTLLSALHGGLAKNGFDLAPTIRPYLRRDGWVTLRFVWRQRGARTACTFTHSLRIRLSDILSTRREAEKVGSGT